MMELVLNQTICSAGTRTLGPNLDLCLILSTMVIITDTNRTTDTLPPIQTPTLQSRKPTSGSEVRGLKSQEHSCFSLILPLGQESRHTRFLGHAWRVAVLAVRFVIGEMKDGFPSAKSPVKVPLTSHCFSQSVKYSLMLSKMTKRNCPSFCLFPLHCKTTDAPNVSLMLEYTNRMIPARYSEIPFISY